MTLVSLPLSSRANTDPNLFSDVYNNDNAIVTVVNGQLQNENLASNAAIAHSKLANGTAGYILQANASGVITATAVTGDVTITNAGVTAIGNTKVTGAMLNASTQVAYRTIFQAKGKTFGATATATFICDDNAAAGADSIQSGTDVNASNVDPPFFNWVTADYTVASLTPKLRTNAVVACNATAPAINYVVGLYPVTVAGAAGVLNFTLGTVVSGSTVTFTTPGASGTTTGVSGDFAVPSNGVYALGFTTSGSAAANNVTLLSAQLQVRNV